MSLLRRASEPPGGDRGDPDVVVVASVDGAPDDGDGDEAPVDPQRWARLARAVLDGEGVDGPAELTLTFVDEATIAELNERWMGEEGPTDVLSFPLDADEAPVSGMPRLLGDVVVCPAVARRNARGDGRRAEDELALLVVHGVLHVLGHDHAEEPDAAAMRASEDRYLTLHHDPAWARSTS